jgi:hypothetical protein
MASTIFYILKLVILNACTLTDFLEVVSHLYVALMLNKMQLAPI